MPTLISEDCLIFYGLSSETTKFRQVYDAISDFMNKKHKIDPSGRFNFVLFLQDGPNYLNHFTFDPEYVLKTLKLLKNDIVKANSFGGILIALSLLIENFKKTSEKLFRLLVLLDENATRIPHDQLSLIEKFVKDIRNLPFYIDIIRIETNNNEESKILKKIANSSSGEFYQIKSAQDLKPLLNKLVGNKFKMEYLYSRYKLKIDTDEAHAFFVSLADKPKAYNRHATCSICFQKDIDGIVQCPSCGTLVHKRCWAQWAISSIIEVPYAFRCHNCFYLLKLDKDFVFNVQIGAISSITKLDNVKKKDINDYLKELESKIEPKVIKAEDPMVAEVRAIIESKRSNSEIIQNDEIITVNICPICNNVSIGNVKNCEICGFTF
ncbi:MAG: hypothetical protein ACFFEY_12245 [Candidatus Thorarchaeota archaeon]